MDIALNITGYVVVNLLLSTAWFIFLSTRRVLLPFVDRLIATFILSITQIIVTELLLGVVFKNLFLIPLFILNISISSAILILSINRYCKSYEKNNTLFLFKDLFCEFKEKTTGIIGIIKRDLALVSLSVLFLLSVLLLILLGYLFPSYTWDAIWYHLPAVGYIIQNGAIEHSSANLFIDKVVNFYPQNMELFFLWNIIFLRSDAIVDLSQFPFVIIGISTIYSICIKLGIREKYALFTSLLSFFIPVIILQSTANYVDIAISTLFLIAINFLIHERTTIHFALSGLTAGILLGTKGSGPFYVMILMAFVLIRESILLMQNKNLKQNLKQYVLYVTSFIIPVFLTGGYWYIKNWAVYGNPLYPIEVSIFNFTIFKGLFKGITNPVEAIHELMGKTEWGKVFKGVLDPLPEAIKDLSPLGRLFYVWQERVEYYLYDSRLSGFGPIWFILFLPALIFSLISSIRDKKYNYLLIAILLITAFIIFPRNWNTRYVIFIIGLGAISFGMVFNYFHNREVILKTIAVLLAGYTFFSANSPCITPKNIKEFLHLSANERTLTKHKPFNIDIHVRKDYGYWEWISKNIKKGDVLAFTFEPFFIAPLWNREFSNKVVYIKPQGYKEWLQSLKKNRVTYVLIEATSVEDAWINKEKQLLSAFWWFGGTAERFKVEYADENYKIMSFKIL